MSEDDNGIDSRLPSLCFILVSNYGCFVKTIRKASTHLTEKPKKGYKSESDS